MKLEEAAAVLGVSRDTVKRDWRFAKMWLLRGARWRAQLTSVSRTASELGQGIDPERDVPPGLFLGGSVGDDRHDTGPVSRHRKYGSLQVGCHSMPRPHAAARDERDTRVSAAPPCPPGLEEQLRPFGRPPGIMPAIGDLPTASIVWKRPNKGLVASALFAR